MRVSKTGEQVITHENAEREGTKPCPCRFCSPRPATETEIHESAEEDMKLNQQQLKDIHFRGEQK